MDAEQASRPAESVRERALAIFFGVGGVVLALFVAFVFLMLWPVAVLLLISLMLVAALTPIVKALQTRFKRKTATTVVVTSSLVGITALIVFTLPPVVTQLSEIGNDLDRLYRQFQMQINERSPEMARLLGQMKVATLPSQGAPQAVKEVVFSAFTIVTSFVTVLMLTVFLVVEGSSVATAMVSVFPRQNRLQVRQMFGEIGEQVGSYIRGQLVTSFIAGMVTYIVLSVFSVPNALALAWLMAILDAIPIVGPLLGIVPAVVSAYGVNNQVAIYVLIALAAYHQVENYLIVPHVYGRALKLSPLAVVLAILVGASLLGIVGAFIALPFAAAIPTVLRHFHTRRNSDDVAPDLPA